MATARLTTRLVSKVHNPSYRLPCGPRFYHSYEHAEPSPFPPSTNAILSASLAHVPTHGFTETALTLGAADAGYPPVSTNLFPRGPFDLINYHLVTTRLGLKDRLRQRYPSTVDGEEAEPWRKFGVGARVRMLALERLWANKEIIHRWQEVNIPCPLFPDLLYRS